MYWPAKRDGKVQAGAGRGEYVRIIFEEAGIPYEEVDDRLVLRPFFGMNGPSEASIRGSDGTVGLAHVERDGPSIQRPIIVMAYIVMARASHD